MVRETLGIQVTWEKGTGRGIRYCLQEKLILACATLVKSNTLSESPFSHIFKDILHIFVMLRRTITLLSISIPSLKSNYIFILEPILFHGLHKTRLLPSYHIIILVLSFPLSHSLFSSQVFLTDWKGQWWIVVEGTKGKDLEEIPIVDPPPLNLHVNSFSTFPEPPNWWDKN